MIADLRPTASSKDSLLARYMQRFQEIRNENAAGAAITNALRLKRADALIKGVFENSFDAIAIFRREGGIEAANSGLAHLFGYTPETITSCSFYDLIVEGLDGVRNAVNQTGAKLGFLDGQARRKDGIRFPVEIAVGEVQLGATPSYLAIVRDITERRAQEERVRHQALHDALTDLPNRVLFNDRLDLALASAERSGEPFAVVIIDLDRFKEVNDTLGHHAGDVVLRVVSERLQSAVRKCDTVARLGGDEFAVLLPALGSEEQALELTTRLVRIAERPFDYCGISIDIGASAGIAVYPVHAQTKDKLLQCADVAMYAAKEEQNRVSIYHASKDRNSIRNLTLAGDLRSAIEQGKIFLAYQPKIDLASGALLGVEALARWKHDDHGCVAPTEFIAQAERNGLIKQLTLLTVALGLGQLSQWRRSHRNLTVAINLSARSLHDAALPDILLRAIEEWRIEPHWLTLEITESAFMVDPEKSMAVVERLAAAGMRLAIDDFGTGYSSLSYLSRLPVNELKIDKSFVLQMLDRDRDAKIVQSTIDLAHNLGLKVVAEGVENEQIVTRLREIGCDVAQGYYFGKPMAAPQIDQLQSRLGESRIIRPRALAGRH